METDPIRTVLVVDDEETVRAPLRRVLESEGHAVLEASDAETALRVLHEKPVHLIISDNMMPGMSGVDLLKLVRVRHPQVLRIMLTGDPDPEIPVRSINESEVYRFIRKPWNDSDLRTIMHFAFEVVRLEGEKRRLLSMVRDERAARLLNGSPEDPVGIESGLLLLAEDELHGS